MTLASIAPVATPTLPRSGQASDDGSPQGGFGAVLADVAQSTEPAASPVAASAVRKTSAQQAVHALLAQISNGSAPVVSAKRGEAADTSHARTDDQAKSADETKDGTKDTMNDATTPDVALADASCLAASLVAMPGAVASAAVVTASKDAGAAATRSRSTAATTTAGEQPDAPDIDAAASPDIEIAVVGTASHLAPASASTMTVTAADAASASTTKDAGTQPDAVLPAGALQTLAGGVASLADEAAGAPAAPEAAQTAPQSTSIAQARSLTLQLSPGTLGSVTVHLHMTSGGLDLRLAVENDETRGAITRARDELTAAIVDSGYKLDSLTIRSADPSSAMAGSNGSSRNDTQSGGTFADDSSRRGSGGESAPQRQRGSSPARETAAARDRGGDGVFV